MYRRWLLGVIHLFTFHYVPLLVFLLFNAPLPSSTVSSTDKPSHRAFSEVTNSHFLTQILHILTDSVTVNTLAWIYTGSHFVPSFKPWSASMTAYLLFNSRNVNVFSTPASITFIQICLKFAHLSYSFTWNKDPNPQPTTHKTKPFWLPFCLLFILCMFPFWHNFLEAGRNKSIFSEMAQQVILQA